MANHDCLPEDLHPDLEPLAVLLPDWDDPEAAEEEFRSDFFRGMAGRRSKAAFVLMAIWGVVIALHLVHWGFALVLILTGVAALLSLRMLIAQPAIAPKLLSEADFAQAPRVSLLVAAKNEEAVIGRLVRRLCNLDYPGDRYEVWVVDDASTDATPTILQRLAAEHAQLKVVRRLPGASGGKSGALNQVLPRVQGEIVGVFDADATVPADLLRRIVPYFEPPTVGALQMRKAIANASDNFWTKGQAAEMYLDAYWQQQRVAVGGIGELRGNGQFVRRTALESCGRWNEQTITDDLDLTIRLHLDGWDIAVCPQPAVGEEGVTTTSSLWHQRNRWAEGGYQRYLDYWRWLARNRLGWSKSLDVAFFIVNQYVLPTAAIPDVGMALLRQQSPLLYPLSGTIFAFAMTGMFISLYRQHCQSRFWLAAAWRALMQTLRGAIYMIHWLVVMPCTTGRMSIRPKRLKWVKTTHQGGGEDLEPSYTELG
ncbi:MAG: glycosyltransferase family 2 protein [Spirulinaceae cyanobacterium SM2_1_0]|nr:glycosyltransferase family 2 protein [Spirulinaceae cyanobacterium SM2_1_0]